MANALQLIGGSVLKDLESHTKERKEIRITDIARKKNSMTNEEAIKFLQQLYPNGGHCWLDEQRIEAIGMAIKALQEEPESKQNLSNVQRTVKNLNEDFENALAEEWKGYNDRGAAKVDALEDNTQELAFAKGFYRGWHYMDDDGLRKAVEGVSEELSNYINELSKQFPEVSFAKLSRIAVRVAKWQKEQMMAKAVEGVVHHFEKCGVASVHYNDPTGVPMAYFTSPEGLSAGDKVKIIVIKED